MDNNQDYCDYNLSLALKECGFDEPCGAFYIPPNKSRTEPSFYGSASTIKNHPAYFCIAAPTLAHAQKWLREKWGIHVDVCVFSDYSTDADGKVCDRWYFWGFDLYAVVGGENIIDDDGEYDSYEQALSAGISAALELIN